MKFLPVLLPVLATVIIGQSDASPVANLDLSSDIIKRDPPTCQNSGGRLIQGIDHRVAITCGAVAGGSLTAGICFSAAGAGMEAAAVNFPAASGVFGVTAGVLQIISAISYSLSGTVAIGTSILYAAGRRYAAGQVVAAANNQLTARDADLQIDWSMATNTTPPIFSHAFIAPANLSLPTLTWADTRKNLTYPFHVVADSGVIMTHFPAGFAQDPDLMYTFLLPSHGRTRDLAAIVDRDISPLSSGVDWESYDASWPLTKRYPEQCGGTVHNVPYQAYPSANMNTGYGVKIEALATCGHPARSGQYVEDRQNAFRTAVNDWVPSKTLVMEVGIHNNQGYTYQNSRFVVETADFDNCYEAQWTPGSNVACCAN